MHTSRFAIAVACALAGAAPLAAQQTDWDPYRIELSRDSLQALLLRLEESSRSPVYSAKLRTRSAVEARLIRARLSEGDFQIGDRVAVSVEGQAALSDTFVVEPGRVLNLPEVGSVPLAGVLRAELEPHLTRAVARVVSNPVVHTQSLIRLAILGDVARPGYYVLPVETLLDEALMRAGGPTGTARLNDIRIERGRERLWEGDAVTRAIAEGRTLNSMSMRAGDVIMVPREGQKNWESIARTIGLAASLPFTILGVLRLF